MAPLQGDYSHNHPVLQGDYAHNQPVCEVWKTSPSSLLLKKRILQIFEKVPQVRLEPTPFAASSLQGKCVNH